MIKDFINTSIENLKLIKNSQNESLHKRDFIISENDNIKLDTLISFLVDNEFIETELDDNIYFLTPDTYNLIESESLKSALLYKMNINNTEDIDGYEDIDDYDVEYTKEELELLKKEQKKDFMGGNRFQLILLLIVMSLASFYKYLFPIKNNSQYKFEINDKMLEKMQKISDSLKVLKSK